VTHGHLGPARPLGPARSCRPARQTTGTVAPSPQPPLCRDTDADGATAEDNSVTRHPKPLGRPLPTGLLSDDPGRATTPRLTVRGSLQFRLREHHGGRHRGLQRGLPPRRRACHDADDGPGVQQARLSLRLRLWRTSRRAGAAVVCSGSGAARATPRGCQGADGLRPRRHGRPTHRLGRSGTTAPCRSTNETVLRRAASPTDGRLIVRDGGNLWAR
jgi:hypothetical protein